MFLNSRNLILIICLLSSGFMHGQLLKDNPKELDIALVIAGEEALYLGINSKMTYNLSKSETSFYMGAGLAIYCDFIGEIEEQSKLENDVDMRIIPNIFIGYNLAVNKFDFSVEIPVGTSIAITRGTLVNTRVGFEQDYSNTHLLWHYGLALNIKYQVSDKNKIGLYAFLPVVEDIAWSSPMYGLSWVTVLGTQ